MNSGKGLRGLAYAAGTLVCLGTTLPLFHGNRWWLRIFDFPRIQITALGAAFLGYNLARYPHLTRAEKRFAALVGLAVAGQLIQIFPYTPLARKRVLHASDNGPDIQLLTCNVFQDNRTVDKLKELIDQRDPDLILLTETDQWWLDQLTDLKTRYPHTLLQPLSNYYGMALYSKFKLINPEIRFLIKNDIPSMRCLVEIHPGHHFLFYGVHPEPPGSAKPNGGIRGSGPRDAELVVVAKELRNAKHPVIVAGDFNDVAWSHTTRLFQRISRLLDPRIGRGFYNSFNANHHFFRYPLDHLFHSEHFSLVNFERLPHVGSDHFPLCVRLRLTPTAPLKQEPPQPQTNDFQEANKILRESPRE
ncbi:MAG: endonuclease/exonuclease/phosphatase family protein [Verrucomicrobiota bacterium]|nr:endonuclease/exonuclease/phosphatase family protein [Verrucomicrobiota bacterium]